MADTFIPERGDLSDVFSGGRGYQPPAVPGAGIPPGWNTDPHLDSNEAPLVIAGTSPGPPPIIAGSDRPPLEFANPALPPNAAPSVGIERAPRAPGSILEFVSLDQGTACFRGHDFLLSPNAKTDIELVLAREVMRTLDEERQRVANSVLDAILPRSSGDRQDMPAMPHAQDAVGKEAPSRPKKVQRVRKSSTPKVPKNVRPVPGTEGGQA